MKHTHNFSKTYDGLIGFGFNRKTDEHTICYYLQKISDDTLMQNLLKKMSDQDLQVLFDVLTRLLRTYLSEEEYHRLFLKDDSAQG